MSQGKGLPPWHMWGSTQQVRISEPGTNVYAKQLTYAAIVDTEGTAIAHSDSSMVKARRREERDVASP